MTDFQAWIPPAGAVVDPPVHPETVVDVIYSDGERQDCTYAHRHNWSAEGDGPCVVAYAVVEEYKPAPKVAREWWLYRDGRQDWEVKDALPTFTWDEIIHVREVLPGREVVAWAVVDDFGDPVEFAASEPVANYQAKRHGGTVVKLTGAKP